MVQRNTETSNDILEPLSAGPSAHCPVMCAAFLGLPLARWLVWLHCTGHTTDRGRLGGVSRGFYPWQFLPTYFAPVLTISAVNNSAAADGLFSCVSPPPRSWGPSASWRGGRAPHGRSSSPAWGWRQARCCPGPCCNKYSLDTLRALH